LNGMEWNGMKPTFTKPIDTLTSLLHISLRMATLPPCR
jgi:hypothetical protein